MKTLLRPRMRLVSMVQGPLVGEPLTLRLIYFVIFLDCKFTKVTDLAQEGHVAMCVSSAFLNRVLLRPLANVRNNMLVKVHHISKEKQDTYITETYWIF